MQTGEKVMNAEAFTGRAKAYAKTRPGYPDEAVDYIRNLVPSTAVFADIGAGTGKFTAIIAKYGYKIFAVEPNVDMREQLADTLEAFPNIKIVNGLAEDTMLPDCSVDVIVCAQALGWFDLKAFREECCRIGKSGAFVVSIYNDIPNDNFVPRNNRLTNKQATDLFFENPIMREFSNPIFYTRERWIQYNESISDNPQPFDAGYDKHIAKVNMIFDHKNVNGLICHDLVTRVFSENL